MMQLAAILNALLQGETFEASHFWTLCPRIYVTSRETILLRSHPLWMKTVYITKIPNSSMAGILAGLKQCSYWVDLGTRTIFCTNEKFLTESGSWVQIFLAAISESVLTDLSGGVVLRDLDR